MLISDTVPSLANGVSQQPPSLRLPSQVEAQDDCYSSLVKGLTRRNPIEHVARLSNTIAACHSHWINRDAVERYEVLITNGDLFVYDLAGNPKTVTFPDGKTYLNSADPKNNFMCLTIADTTFITNRATVTAKTTPVSPPNPSSSGLIYVRQAAYNVVYKVYVDNVLRATHTVPASSGADTEVIATSLASLLGASLGGTWTISQYGSVLKIVKNDGSTFALQTKDSVGDSYLFGFTDKTQRFENLPAKGFDGFTVEISGDTGNELDSYWVRYDKANNTWIETVNPREADTLNNATMPHILVREPSGDFTFKKAPWVARDVGDRNSAPDPSFIGKSIYTLFFESGRLGMLSDDNYLFSAISNDGFFRYFPTTVQQALAGAPIDDTSGTAEISKLKWAISYNEDLIFFSDLAQQRLNTGDELKQGSTSLKSVGGYACDLTAEPINNGKTLAYATDRGTYAGVSELFVDKDTGNKDSADITAHVPSYIPRRITRFTANTKENVQFVQSSGALDKLYVYKWYWNGNEKLQSSWSRWLLPSGSTLISTKCIDNWLYLLVNRDEGLFLERINLEFDQVDSDLGFIAYMDRRLKLTGVYDAVNNWTTWTLPFNLPLTTSLMVCLGGAFTGRVGSLLSTVTRPTLTTVRCSGDYSAGQCYIGIDYSSRFTLSEILIGQKGDKGRVNVKAGSLHLRRVEISHSNTAAYIVRMTPEYGEPSDDPFVGNVLGSGDTLLGTLNLNTGTHKVRPLGRADQMKIEILSVKHLPFSIISYEWEGNYVTRSRRI